MTTPILVYYVHSWGLLYTLPVGVEKNGRAARPAGGTG